MNFILRLAWRDSRASRRRLLLYSSTIVLGIAALVAVGSFGANLRKTVGDQPKRLLGADIRIGLGSWPNPDLQKYLDSIGAAEAREKIFSSPLSGRGENAPRRAVQVVALDPSFPLYGEFLSLPADAVSRFRRGEKVALLDPRVAGDFHLGVGDPIKLDCGDYMVAGIVREIPGESSLVLSLMHRVYVPWSGAVPDVPAGKAPDRGNYRLFLRLSKPADLAAVASEIKSHITDSFSILMTADEMAKNIDQALVHGNQFFSLVVFAALILGAIGVASALHVHIQERIGTVAILRCLGASSSQGMAIYLCQTAALGACGAAGGALLGVAAQFVLPRLLRDMIPMHLEVFLAWRPVLAGMGAGFLICLVFALLPLLAVRRVPPLAALRSEPDAAPARDPARIAVWFLVAASVAGFAYWQTRNWRAALAYTAALAISFGIFAAAASAIAKLARRFFPKSAPFVIRQGVANLYRPRNRTTLLLLALGMGLFIVLTVYLVRSTLKSDFTGENSANLVISEVAEDQNAAVLAAANTYKLRVVQSIPSLDLTLESINGLSVEESDKRRHRSGAFSENLHPRATYRSSLLPYEKSLQGSFVGRVRPGSAVIPISIARRMTGRQNHLMFGDAVVWNVEGVPIRTQVTNIRLVQGLHLEPNFAVVFPEGALDSAPKKIILLLRAQTPADSARLERALGASFPKIRVFDLAVLIESIERVFAKVVLVVDFIAFFTIATGMVILAAAVVAGRHQRARESVLLRTLGATRRQIRLIQLTEYAVVGALAGLIGCGLAAAANELLAHYVFRIPATGGGFELGLAGASVVGIAVATGVLADRGLSRLSPLEILREET